MTRNGGRRDDHTASFGGWESSKSTDHCLDLKMKALESSARMESHQHKTAKMSEIKENLMINQTEQGSQGIQNGFSQDLLTIDLPCPRSQQSITRNINSSESLIGCSTKPGGEDINKQVLSCQQNQLRFNKNKDTLPSIRKRNTSVEDLVNKLTGGNETTIPFSSMDPLSIITKYEARIRTRSLIRDVSKEFVSAAARMIEPFHQNLAPEIIESNEGKVGRPYQRFGGYPAGSAILYGNYKLLGSRSDIKPGKSSTSNTNIEIP